MYNDFMRKRFWTIFGFVIIIGFGVFLFLAWRPEQEKKETQKALFPGKSANVQKPENLSQTGQKLVFIEPKPLEFKPFFSARGGEEDLEKFGKTFLEQFSSLSHPSFSTEEQGLPTKTEIEKPKKTLTDEEWFKIAYPASYLEYLATIEKVMHDEGFLSSSEKFEFTSQKKINLFLHKTVDFFLQKGFIDEKQADNIRQGIDIVLPELQKQERKLYEQKLTSLLFQLIKIAYAQYPLFCFRFGLPIPGGFNLIAPCCDCGFDIGRRGRLIFVEHCSGNALPVDIYSPYYDPVTGTMSGFLGAGTGSCAINLGCLNAVCPGQAAIWDPMTGICGCSFYSGVSY
jgi:hypothetical protein